MQPSASTAIRTPEDFLHGASIIREIKASGIEFVVSVPDITTSEGLLRPLAQESGKATGKETAPRLIRVCKEDEGVGICAGLSYCGRRSLLLIQQTGLLDSINAIRGVAVEYALPICMMVGRLRRNRGPRRGIHRYWVRIVEPGSSSGDTIKGERRLRPMWRRSFRRSMRPMRRCARWFS
jgi:hypothetical protein